MIACVYAAYFVAELEREAHGFPRSTPLLVCTAPTAGRVTAACAAAQENGVRAGMTQSLARVRCPDAAVVVAAPARYERASDDVSALLSAWSSRIAPGPATWRAEGRKYPTNHQPGAACWFLDLGRVGMAEALELAAAITAALTGHPHISAVVAVAPTRFAACCAAQYDGMSYLTAARVEQFLAPLPIELLPLDEPAWEWLRLLGLATLGQLAALPPGALETQLGGAARLLWQLARGRDHDPVPPYVPAPGIRAVRRADGAVSDRYMLLAAIESLAAQLAARLQRRGATARTVALELQLEYDAPWEGRLTLDTPTSQPEPLHMALRSLLGRAQVVAGVERLAVTLGGLQTLGGTQLGLWDEAPRRSARGEAVAGLIARFGPGRIFFAAPLRPQARVPEWRFGLRHASER